MTVTDQALSYALESTEALGNAAFVDARAVLEPDLGATWMKVVGAYAMYDGVGSPLTQCFGLGISETPTVDDLARIEAFFDQRGADTILEISPLADPSLLRWLPARGYVPIELTSVMYRSLESLPDMADERLPHVRIISDDERGIWADRSAAGWGTEPEFAGFIRGLAWVNAHSNGVHCFVAEIDGEIIATGGLAIHHGNALLAGASTLPAYRSRGAQTALLGARLGFARSLGCSLAIMGAAPGSTSQLNAERQGFRIAYTRIKWQRPAGMPA